MVACEGLLVDVDQLVARRHHKGRSELGGPATCLVLPVTSGEGSRSGKECIRPQQRCGSESIHLNHVRCLAFLVEEYGERHGFILDERHGVSSVSRADGGHTGAGCDEFLVSISDLTGPLAAGESAEMSEKQENVRIIGPQIPQSMCTAIRIVQREIGESRRIECHPFPSVALGG